MIFIHITLLAAIYLISGLLLIFILWLYYDRRDSRQFEKMRNPTVFVCVRCDHIYSTPQGVKKTSCPHCSHENIPLRF